MSPGEIIVFALAFTAIVMFVGAALSHGDRKYRSEVAPGSLKLARYDEALCTRSRRP